MLNPTQLKPHQGHAVDKKIVRLCGFDLDRFSKDDEITEIVTRIKDEVIGEYYILSNHGQEDNLKKLRALLS